jgi:WD40 repeat protein
MCKLCKDKIEGEKIQHVVDLFDEDVTALLEDKAHSQAETPQSLDDRHSAVFDQLNGMFSALRQEMNDLLTKTEENVKNRFRDFMEKGEGNVNGGCNWTDIKGDFMSKRNEFLKSDAGKADQTLVDFLKTYNSTMSRLANAAAQDSGDGKGSNSSDPEFEINSKLIDNFKKTAVASLEHIEQKMFSFKLSSSVSVKVDQIKEELGSFSLPSKGVFKAIAVMEEHGVVAVGGTDGVLSLLDAETLKVRDSFKAHPKFISGVEYIPSRGQLVTCSLDRTIKVFNVSEGGKIKENNSFTLTGHKGFIFSIKFLSDINKLASVGFEPEIKLWDLDSKQSSGISTNGWASDSYEIMHAPNENLIGVVGKDVIRLYDYTSKDLV